MLCCSLAWSKCLEHYRTILLHGWPLRLGETLPPRNSKPRSAVSFDTQYVAAPWEYLGDVIAKILLYVWLPTDATTQTRFQWFVSDPLLSSFKKLIMSTLRLLCDLHRISLAKAAPEGLKDRECKKVTLVMQAPSNSLCPWERLCSGDCFCLQSWESQDPDWQRYWSLSSYLVLQDAQSFSHSRGICFRSNQEKGLLQGLQSQWSLLLFTYYLRMVRTLTKLIALI
jgi:hypothetical protein